MIFGTRSPKFIYDKGGASETSVQLDYVVVLQDAPENENLSYESVVNGHREFTFLGSHWIYEIRIHLFKYSDPIFIRSKYEEIKQFTGKDVVLYRHRDGDQFKDSSGNDVLFNLVSVDAAYLDTPDYKDVLILTFKSKDYVDLSDGSEIIPQPSEVVMSNGLKTDL